MGVQFVGRAILLVQHVSFVVIDSVSRMFGSSINTSRVFKKSNATRASFQTYWSSLMLELQSKNESDRERGKV